MLYLHRDKPVHITGKDLREMRTFAKNNKLHFADGIKKCPRCGREIGPYANRDGQPSRRIAIKSAEEYGEHIAREIMLIHAQADMMNLTATINGIANKLTTQTKVIGDAIGTGALPKDANIRDEILRSVEAINALREQLNAFAGVLLQAAEQFDREGEESSDQGAANHGA
jgi:hypothetical protein